MVPRPPKDLYRLVGDLVRGPGDEVLEEDDGTRRGFGTLLVRHVAHLLVIVSSQAGQTP